MIKNICIVEDDKYENLLPLVYMRPVYDLRCGILTLREKIEKLFPSAKIFLHCRKYLEEKVKEINKNLLVNNLSGLDSCLFVNGRTILNSKIVEQISKKEDALYFSGETFVAAKLSSYNLEKVISKLDSVFTTSHFEGIERSDCETTIINYPWDLISNNGEQILSDFVFHKTKKKNIHGKVYEGAVLLNEKDIFIGVDSVIKPGVVIDAEEGPVYIGKNVKVMPNAVIVGPCFVGDNSIIKIAAKVYENTSIGEFCKVGGEVEGSIIHSYANKQHDGFLGHSYISPWCNLGADTNNSDLKNNYGNIKVIINDKQVDSGKMFVGLVMGDHSKTSINTMFNTGTVCGVASNIFGSGFPPKYIPSFAWGGADSMTTYNLNNGIDVAKKVMARRKVEFTETDKILFTKVFELSRKERTLRGMPD
ncbi:MAG: GlmU family protein [Ignavibacteriales bacterium]|nr:GlmU family protein [Ignavibacteriales bacterium]